MNDFDILMAKERQQELLEEAERIMKMKFLKKKSSAQKNHVISHLLAIIFQHDSG